MDWNSIVEQLGPGLLRYFLGYFPRQIASELVQETILRLVRKVEGGQYEPAKGGLIKFAYGIARFVKLETLKGLRPETLSETAVLQTADSQSRSPEEAYEHEDRLSRLRRHLTRLPEIQRDIFLLVLGDDLRLPEVAEILGMPLGTVKSHIHRAKSTLFESMRAEEEMK